MAGVRAKIPLRQRTLLLAVAYGGVWAAEPASGTAVCAGGMCGQEVADGSDQTSLLQARGSTAGRKEEEPCGGRRRRYDTCSCRRRNGVGVSDGRLNLACVENEIKEMPRRVDGGINLNEMMKWIYQEPLIVNLMNLPVVACQDRAGVFFNCQVLQPNHAVSIQSSLPYQMYSVLGTDKPSNWDNLRNVLGTTSKLIGPVAVIAAAYTGGTSVVAGGVASGAVSAVRKVVEEFLTKGATQGIAQLVGQQAAQNVIGEVTPKLAGIIGDLIKDGLQDFTRQMEEETPGMLSGWSSTLDWNEHHLKIVGGVGGDQEQHDAHASKMQIVEVSKADFAKLKVTAILPGG